MITLVQPPKLEMKMVCLVEFNNVPNPRITSVKACTTGGPKITSPSSSNQSAIKENNKYEQLYTCRIRNPGSRELIWKVPSQRSQAHLPDSREGV
jgi:hypothetical protein